MVKKLAISFSDFYFMPKVSVNILTKNRIKSLQTALNSVFQQSFQDLEILIVNDCSTDDTKEFLSKLQITSATSKKFKIIDHQTSLGIVLSRQEALKKSSGEYVAILDDDDYWTDIHKLKKQVEFLENNRNYVLVGGGINLESTKKSVLKFRTQTDLTIRQTMLFRNNFFTSTVVFRRSVALKAGGFLSDGIDLCEDYDLWLRLGKLGKMYNFKEVFARYASAGYNIEKFKQFFLKQLLLAKKNRYNYPHHFLAENFLKTRLFLLNFGK